MRFDIEHEGSTSLAINREDALALGYPVAVVNAALKGAAMVRVAVFADDYRARLSSASAGKLATYRIKEELARNRETADEAELALISREAKARGTNRTGLLNDIAAKATAYRKIALLVDAIEAETNAAIAAIPDAAADIEAQIEAALATGKGNAETAFIEALALINGESG